VPGWVLTARDNKLILKGWKDARTGTTHAIKNVSITSDDMPKSEVPRVTLPGRKT